MALRRSLGGSSETGKQSFPTLEHGRSPHPPDISWLSLLQPTNQPDQPTHKLTLSLHPTLALACLRQRQTAVARIWLLLRHLDGAGRGWVTEKEARDWLTGPQSQWQICGPRQLRNLWGRGDGLFWMRQNGRLWLKSVVKVAAALGVEKLHGRPVTLDAKLLTEKIGTVRAHFYATFHSSRKSAPIARQTLTRLCGVSDRSQQTYERKAKVICRRNFVVGATIQSELKEEQAWQHGRAAFELRDVNGRQGQPGRSYLAWQLPNSYEGPHAPKSRGAQKRINRALADLLTQGTAGNGQPPTDANFALPRRFFGNGRTAVKANQSEVYWPSHLPQFWHVLKKDKPRRHGEQ